MEIQSEDRRRVGGEEAGEISESTSVGKIEEGSFNSKKPLSAAAAAAALSRSVANSLDANFTRKNISAPNGARVLTMTDLHKYQIASRTSYSGLYNLAWMQAVNNKPFEEVFVMMDENDKPNCSADVVEGCVEKEDGELEEGEIDGEADVITKSEASNTEMNNSVVDEVKSSDIEINKLVDAIKKELSDLNLANAEESYDKCFSFLESTVDGLRKMSSLTSLAEKDELPEVLLTAIKSLHLVLSSMALRFKAQRNAMLLRLVGQITSLEPNLFSPQQLRQVEAINSSIEPMVDSLPKNIELDSEITGSRLLLEKTSDSSGPKNSMQRVSQPSLKSGLLKGLSLPLLDIHKDHDADSLPSPTSRVFSPPTASKNGFIQSNDYPKPEWPPIPNQSPDRESFGTHPYETDALKAVSSYQQKFGQKSFSVNDELPSPTPSGEGGSSTGDGDINGEISSSSVKKGVQKPAVYPTPPVNAIASSKAPSPGVVSVLGDSGKPVTISSMKSRDPRLRFANMDAGSKNLSVTQSVALGLKVPNKNNTSEELALEGPALKKPRKDLSGVATTFPTVIPVSTMPVSCPTRSLPITGPTVSPLIYPVNGTASITSVLRDKAVNPSLLMNVLQMMNQNSSSDAETRIQTRYLNCTQGANTQASSGSTSVSLPVPRKISEADVPNPQEGTAARMKPRDPRRILYTSGIQKNATAESAEKSNMNTSSCSAAAAINISSPMPESQLKNSIMPDIPAQCNGSLRNDTAVQPSSANTQTSSMPAQSHESGIEARGVAASECGSLNSQAPNTNPWGDVDQFLEGFNEQQRAAFLKERARRLEEQKKMFAARKLCLVLDLDHTLLNSAMFAEVDPLHDEVLRMKEEQDRDKPHRHLFRFPHMAMWTKLRPGIWNFLNKASRLYELHLYTMGNKSYATEMAKLLDPNGELFSGRVISRGDNGESFDSDERVPKSKDLEGVLGMESAVVIIDDSLRVWPHNKLNLIIVERYIYFPCSRRQFGLPGPSLLEIDHDERPEDGTLAAALTVIGKIHENFFSHRCLDEADVRTILASEQRKILSGCRIVFSRVFPVGEANPHMHPLWQMAEQFGAVCVNQVDEQVTHVVANSLGTDKVNWALLRGRFVVHPGWVEASSLLYRRANEHDFAINQPPQ